MTDQEIELLMNEREIRLNVVSTEFTKLGYASEAELLVCPGIGAYYAYVWLNKPDGREEQREVNWEPSEPEIQSLGVRWALRDPEAAVLDLIRTDIGRREEEAA